MDKLNKLIEQALTEDSLWEMTNLRPKRTGLTMCIYVSERKGSHGPRVKFMNGYGDVQAEHLCTITVEDNPQIIAEEKIILKTKDINDLKKWIALNQQLLVDLWNKKIDEVDFIEQMKSI